MVFYIILALIVLVPLFTLFIARWVYNSARDPWDWAWSIAGPLAIGCVVFGGVIIAIISMMASSPDYATAHWTKPKSYALAALNLKTEQKTEGSVNGAFTFLWGSVDSHGERKIDYIQDVTGDGGFAPKTLAASDAIIYEGDGSPHVNISKRVYVNTNHVLVPWDVTYDTIEYRHEFFVPKGSIISDFTVDNKK